MLTSVRETSNGTTNLVTATYAYDVFGHRIEEDKWVSGSGLTQTRLAYDGNNVWADLTTTNTVVMRYVVGNNGQQLLARIDGSGNAGWYLQDRLGSVRNVLDASGAVADTIKYDGYGNITSETSATNGGRYLFQGESEDRNLLVFFADNRVDKTTIGRWLQQDPLMFRAGDANIYRFVGNNPLNAADPTGLKVDVPLSFLINAEYKALDKEATEEAKKLADQVTKLTPNAPKLEKDIIEGIAGLIVDVKHGPAFIKLAVLKSLFVNPRAVLRLSLSPTNQKDGDVTPVDEKKQEVIAQIVNLDTGWLDLLGFELKIVPTLSNIAFYNEIAGANTGLDGAEGHRMYFATTHVTLNFTLTPKVAKNEVPILSGLAKVNFENIVAQTFPIDVPYTFIVPAPQYYGDYPQTGSPTLPILSSSNKPQWVALGATKIPHPSEPRLIGEGDIFATSDIKAGNAFLPTAAFPMAVPPKPQGGKKDPK